MATRGLCPIRSQRLPQPVYIVGKKNTPPLPNVTIDSTVIITINYRLQAQVARDLICCVVETQYFKLADTLAMSQATLAALVGAHTQRGIKDQNLKTIPMQPGDTQVTYSFNTTELGNTGFVNMTVIVFDPLKNIFATDILRLDSGIPKVLGPDGGPFETINPTDPDILIGGAQVVLEQSKRVVKLFLHLNCGDGQFDVTINAFDNLLGTAVKLLKSPTIARVDGFSNQSFTFKLSSQIIPANVYLTASVGDSVSDKAELIDLTLGDDKLGEKIGA